jgi:hypothetical protein
MSEKSDRKRLQKEGARRFATRGDRSAWAAHKGRRCLLGCHYCHIERTVPKRTVLLIRANHYATYRAVQKQAKENKCRSNLPPTVVGGRFPVAGAR